LLTAYDRNFVEGAKCTFEQSVKALCRRIGNDHHARSHVLPHTLNIAAEWFLRHDSFLTWREDFGRIKLAFAEPKIPKSSTRRHEQWAREDSVERRGRRAAKLNPASDRLSALKNRLVPAEKKRVPKKNRLPPLRRELPDNEQRRWIPGDGIFPDEWGDPDDDM
jgi:hypothetical protein